MQAILIGALLAGVPSPAGPPAPAHPRAKGESRKFARALHVLSEQIVRNYVKPLAPEDVHLAALEGLYRAAHIPPPKNLRTQVRQAATLATALRQQSSPEPILPPGEDPREQLLANCLESLNSPPSGDAALRAAARGIVTLLDEHSGLVTVEEQRQGAAGLDRYRQGVGLEFDEITGLGPMTVRAVHLGGPAQYAGMRPGDVITHLDDVPISEVEATTLVALRTGRVNDAPRWPPGEDAPETVPVEVRVRYQRPGEKEDRAVTLKPTQFHSETVLGVGSREDHTQDHWLDAKQKLAYLRVTALGPGTAQDVQAALEGLREAKMRGLVLDLRWCPGGYLREATDTAELFLGNAVIATEKSRTDKDVVYRSSREGEKYTDFPLVVLVNHETVGGAELIAAALRDNDRATVVGQRTHGKGSVQTVLAVSPGLTMKLTKGTFVRPSGKNLHRFADSGPSDDWGVIPDEDVRVSPQLGRRFREWHQAQALRPWDSDERLPLDDPTADSQRVAALAALRKLFR